MKNRIKDERLIQFREALNYSQEEIAKILGIKRSSYSSIENGDANLSSEHIMKLVKSLCLNPLWYFVNEGSMYYLGGNIDNNKTTTIGNVNNGMAENMISNFDTKGDKDLIHQIEILKIKLSESENNISILKKYIKNLENTITMYEANNM